MPFFLTYFVLIDAAPLSVTIVSGRPCVAINCRSFTIVSSAVILVIGRTSSHLEWASIAIRNILPINGPKYNRGYGIFNFKAAKEHLLSRSIAQLSVSPIRGEEISGLPYQFLHTCLRRTAAEVSDIEEGRPSHH